MPARAPSTSPPAPERAGPDVRQQERNVGHDQLDVPAQHVAHRRTDAAIGNVHEIDAGLALEQFDREMGDRARSGRAEIDLARMGAGIGDEIVEG